MEPVEVQATVLFWPLGIYFAAILFLVALIIALSWFLGERHREPATGSPFESGIVSEGSAHVRLSVKFYVIAMFFVIFDLEAVFIFAWAVAARELGWTGYAEISVFIGVLLAVLVYLWRIGALDWGSMLRKRPEPQASIQNSAQGASRPHALVH